MEEKDLMVKVMIQNPLIEGYEERGILLSKFEECIFDSALDDDESIKENETRECDNIYIKDIISLIIPEGVTKIKKSTFKNYTNLEYVIFPKSLKTLKSYAFENCPKLKNIKLPENLEKIGYLVFGIQDSSIVINLPKSLKSLKATSFGKAKLIIDSQSPYFCQAEDGIIYSKNKKIMYWASIDKEVITLADGLETIKEGGFSGCKKLPNIDLPNSIKSIEIYAFANCFNLENIKISSGIKKINYGMFFNCKNLTTLTIPPNIKAIKDHAFENCTGFKELIIPETVTNIQEDAFAGWTKDQTIIINSNKFTDYCNLETDAKVIFLNSERKEIKDDIKLKVKIEKGDNDAFDDEIWLSDISKDSNFCINSYTLNKYRYISTCNNYYIKKNEHIKAIEFSEGIEELKGDALNNCNNLESVIFPNSLKIIGTNISYNSYMLSNLVLSENIERVEENAFKNCGSYSIIKLPKTLQYFSSSSFGKAKLFLDPANPYFYQDDDGVIYTKDKKELVWVPFDITNLEILEGITSFDFNILQYHTSLKTIKLPNSLKFLQSYNFYNCTALEVINIPNGISELPYELFNNCKSLKSFTIPANIKTIANSAFCDCKNIKELFIPRTVEDVHKTAFAGWTKDQTIIIESTGSLNNHNLITNAKIIYSK